MRSMKTAGFLTSFLALHLWADLGNISGTVGLISTHPPLFVF